MKYNCKKLSVLFAAVMMFVLACPVTVLAAAEEEAGTPAVYATFWSLIPPVVAIVLALITKEVYSSLFLGILVGALLYSGGNFEGTVNHIFSGGMISVLSSGSNVGILVFLVILGTMVCLMNRACSRCNSSYTESIAKLPEEQHTHNYTGSITKEATCTEAGVRTYTCSCGDSYTENIPATGHSYVSKVTKAATTTEEGIMTYTCSKCGHSYTQPIAMIKSDNSNKDNGNQNQKPQSGTDNGNQNQKPQPDTDNGKDNGTSIKPYIKDDSGKEGWDVIKPQLEEAKSGDTVTVAMNGTTVVPKDVIDSIKGKDTTLVLDMGNGLSWKIYGQDITDAAGDIDFDVTVGADAGKSIPVDVINNVTGERSSLNLTLAYDGEFGFTATLTVNMESKNAGLYANLFYYNEQTGELEFISAGQIDADGNVELVFTHASDYTIVVDAKIMSDNGQTDNKSDETIPAPKTDDSTSKYAWNNTIIIIIGICIILIVFGAVFYVRKKSGSEEE